MSHYLHVHRWVSCQCFYFLIFFKVGTQSYVLSLLHKLDKRLCQYFTTNSIECRVIIIPALQIVLMIHKRQRLLIISRKQMGFT